MPDYLQIKLIHQLLVFTSLGYFGLRCFWMSKHSTLLTSIWGRKVPHMIDSLLLLSGVALIHASGITPFNAPWLAVKLLLLVVYIVMGAIALKYGRTTRIKTVSGISAWLCVCTMLLLAFHKPTFFSG